MKILVVEYVTGGGLVDDVLSPSILSQGNQMRDALLSELTALPGIFLSSFLDARLKIPLKWASTVKWHIVEKTDSFYLLFLEHLTTIDAVWPIAPETNGVLAMLCRAVEQAGKILLTSPEDAVRLTTSKLATIRRLIYHGVPCIPTLPWTPSLSLPRFPVVVKLDDGISAEGTYLLKTPSDWENFISTHNPRLRYSIQPFIKGDAVSLSALFCEGDTYWLSANWQRILERKGCFMLQGCSVNGMKKGRNVLQGLLRSVGWAIPELWGYAGIDLLWTERGPIVLEINPRVTLSYVGLYSAIGMNIAECVLILKREKKWPYHTVSSEKCVDISVEPYHDI